VRADRASARALWRATSVLALGLAAPAVLAQETTPTAPAQPTAPGPLAQAATDLGLDLTQPLNLQQCTALMIAAHPNVAAALAQLQASQASLEAARAALFPTLDFQADYTTTQQAARQVQTGGTIITVSGGKFTNQNQTVTLSYVFWRTGRDEPIAQARHYLEAAEAGQRDTERLLEFGVAQAFFNLLAARRLDDVAREQVASWEEHIKMVQAQIDAGSAAPVDIHTVRASLAQARLSLIQADNAVASNQAQLQAALGSAREAVNVQGDFAPPSGMLLLDEAQSLALENRPDLQEAAANIAASELSVRLARLGTQPNFNITGEAQYGRYSGLLSHTWTLFGQVTYPIFDGNQGRSQVKQAKANLAAQKAQLDASRNTVLVNVQTQWLAIREAAESIASTQEAVAEARAALDAATGRYQANRGIILEVTDAQLALNQAEVSAVQALYNYHTADAALTEAIGGLAVRTVGPPE